MRRERGESVFSFAIDGGDHRVAFYESGPLYYLYIYMYNLFSIMSIIFTKILLPSYIILKCYK